MHVFHVCFGICHTLGPYSNKRILFIISRNQHSWLTTSLKSRFPEHPSNVRNPVTFTRVLVRVLNIATQLLPCLFAVPVNLVRFSRRVQTAINLDCGFTLRVDIWSSRPGLRQFYRMGKHLAITPYIYFRPTPVYKMRGV